MTNIATKDLPKRQGADASVLQSLMGSEGPVFAPSQSPRLAQLQQTVAPGTMSCDVSCTICPAFNLLCCGAKDGDAGTEDHTGKVQLAATVHTIPARRLILHPKEW